MTCYNSGIWFYGIASRNISGTKYGTLTRIKTPSSLPQTTCSVAYWVSCRSTNLDENNNHRFYQATIAYTPSAGYWHFSWGYSANHLSQPPYQGLTPATNHDYELGIRFTGSEVEAYVIELTSGVKYTIGTVSDNGTMWVNDNPGFILEGFTTQISEMNVDAFKAYTFNVFLSPYSSQEWPNAAAFKQESGGSVPSGIHTYDMDSHQYLIGKTMQGSQLSDGTSLW
jgi:hypothetical protein